MRTKILYLTIAKTYEANYIILLVTGEWTQRTKTRRCSRTETKGAMFYEA